MDELLLPDDYDPVKRLEELLRASSGIQLDTLPLGTTKLSKFTLKQMSRAKPLRKPKRKKQHYHTVRKKKRIVNSSKWGKYGKLKSLHKELWQITEEEWDMLWDYIGSVPFRIGRYDRKEPYRLDTIWVEDKKRKKLWEGYEDKLRSVGAIL
jgi:hypothetical protein